MSLLVAIVDGDEEQVPALAKGLSALGYQVCTATSPLDGLIAIEDRRPQVVVLRWRVDDGVRGSVIDSDVMLRAMRLALAAPPAVIALVDSPEDGDHAMQLGAGGYVMSGVDGEELLQKVNELLQRIRIAR